MGAFVQKKNEFELRARNQRTMLQNRNVSQQNQVTINTRRIFLLDVLFSS
jgi:hypothetical protein